MILFTFITIYLIILLYTGKITVYNNIIREDLTMARKQQPNSKREVYSIRITKSEKELLKKNPTLKTDLDKYVRMYLSAFST